MVSHPYAVSCNLVHFDKKLTFLQFSTFVNENIAMCSTVVLIDIVACYFNSLV